MSQNVIDEMIKILDKGGYNELSKKLDDAQTTGATGGEVVTNIAIVLQEIKHEQPKIYELIKHEANIFFEKYNSFLF